MAGRASLRAASGPAAVAAATFAATLAALGRLAPEEFGGFAVLLVAVNLGASLSNALVGAPLAVLANRPDAPFEAREAVRSAGALLAVAVAAAAGALALALGEIEAVGPAAVFGLFATARWNLRSLAFALHAPQRALRADFVHAGTLGVGIVALWIFRPGFALGEVLAVFAAATAFGWIAGGPGRDALARPRLSGYRAVWRDKSRWSLLGVITTDLTANAHAYIVTAVAGPAAFAPLAAAQLPFRPVGVMAAALVQFERPRMAREISAGRPEAARRMGASLGRILALTWAASTLAAFAVLVPSADLREMVFPAAYDPVDLVFAAVFWALIWGLRNMRMSASALLQAADRFRPLAFASCHAAAVSLAGVAAGLHFGGPIASLGGLLLGEILFTGHVRIEASLLRKDPGHG